MPRWIRSKEGAKKSICPSNLKEVWLAERNWRFDHGAGFPWQTPTNRGGTMEFAETPDVFRHFQVNSNELPAPKILVCPSDTSRTVANSFGDRFDNSNVSYFVGLDADEKQPGSFLHGDRNIVGGITTKCGMNFGLPNTAAWDASKHGSELHGPIGFLVIADGSVQGFTSLSLREALADLTKSNAVHLAIPRLPDELSKQ